MLQRKIKIELSKQEIITLIQVANWATKAYFDNKKTADCVRTSEVCEKLNRAIRENLV